MKLLDTLGEIPHLPLFTEGGFSPNDDSWRNMVMGSTPLRIDTFNRANASSLGIPSDAGSAWIDNNSAGNISSNTAIGNPSLDVGKFHPLALQSSYSNVYVETTVVDIGSTTGLLFDYDDSLGAGSESYAGFVFGTDWANPSIVVVVGGTILYSIAVGVTIANTDVVALQVADSNVYLYVNNVLISSYPVINNGNTKQGIILSNDSALDSFSITIQNDTSASLNLYTSGAVFAGESLMLYVGGGGLPCEASLPLTCWNQTIIGTLPLYTIGEGVESGAVPVNNTLLLFIKAPYGAMLPLYTYGSMLGGDLELENDDVRLLESGDRRILESIYATSATLDLYISGAGFTTASLPLSVPIVSQTNTNTLKLYTHGY